jgi:hypothetical protein
MKHGAFSMISKAHRKEFAMETADIPMAQECSQVEMTNEENAHHFLRYQGYCSL